MTFAFEKFEPKHPNLGTLSQKVLTKFCLSLVLKELISNQTFVSKTFKPKSTNFGVSGQKKPNFLILTKLRLPLFNGGDFNYTFEQKSQNVRLMGQN